MTISTYPVDGSNVLEADWYDYIELAKGGDGVALNHLNGLQSLLPYGDSSGRQVKVKTGWGMVGGAIVKIDAEVTVSLTTNSSGSTRYDGIMLQVDRTGNTASLVAVVGTTNPNGPSPTQTTSTWQIKLAVVTLTNGYSTVNAADVRDLRPICIGIDGYGGKHINLFDSTLAADGAQIDTTAILPGGFFALEVEVYAQGASAVTNLASFLEINGDTTAANYSEQFLLADNTSITGARINPASGGIQLPDLPGASASAGGTNQWMNGKVYLPGYSLGTRKKWRTDSGNYLDAAVTYPRAFRTEGTWDSVAIINRLRYFQQGAANLKAGSRLRVTGIK